MRHKNPWQNLNVKHNRRDTLDIRRMTRHLDDMIRYDSTPAADVVKFAGRIIGRMIIIQKRLRKEVPNA